MKLIAIIEGLTITVVNEAQGVGQVLLLDARNPGKTWGNNYENFVLPHLPYIWYRIKNLGGPPSNELEGFWVLKKQDLRISPGASINGARRLNNLKVLHDDSPDFHEDRDVLHHHRLSFDRGLSVEDKHGRPGNVLPGYLSRELESEQRARLSGRVFLTDGVLEGDMVREGFQLLPLISLKNEAGHLALPYRRVAPMTRLVLDFGPGINAVTIWSTSFFDDGIKNQLTLRPAEGENEVVIRIGNVEVDDLDRTVSQSLTRDEHNDRDRDFRLFSELISNPDHLGNRWWPIHRRRSGQDVDPVPGCIDTMAYSTSQLYNGAL